jgi:NAD(P)-dependent dehydrogenase (short-subunit alcohol dehydrogenase family)
LADLSGKVAVISGAGTGIGRAIAELFAKQGAAVVIAEIDTARGRAAAAALSQQGTQALFVETDVANDASVRQMVEAAVSRFGTLHILVNNAGIEMYRSATDTTLAEWEQSLNVNLRGVWLCAKYALPHIVAAGGGAVVNISSFHAHATVNHATPYAAAKGGVVAMTRSMALDYGPHNVRVNCICPGVIQTSMWERYLRGTPDPEAARQTITSYHPIGRLGRPEDIAYGALYLASDEAGFVTGTTLFIDGGVTARLV